jgi:hypothetical protein
VVKRCIEIIIDPNETKESRSNARNIRKVAITMYKRAIEVYQLYNAREHITLDTLAKKYLQNEIMNHYPNLKYHRANHLVKVLEKKKKISKTSIERHKKVLEIHEDYETRVR